MKELFIRALTGLVYVLVVIGSIFYNEHTFLVFIILVTLFATNETINLLNKAVQKLNRKLLIFFAALLLIWNHSMLTRFHESYININPYMGLLFIIILILGVVFIKELFGQSENPMSKIGGSLFALIYPGLFALFLMYIPYGLHGAYNPELIMGIFILMWSSDTGAYLAGKSFGKHKLYPRISPGKTWEGSIGGLILALISSYFISIYFESIDTFLWMTLAIVVTSFGTIGDLVESMLKRLAGVKDSGNILPGHGGMLDRFDSILFAAPFIYMTIVIYQLIHTFSVSI